MNRKRHQRNRKRIERKKPHAIAERIAGSARTVTIDQRIARDDNRIGKRNQRALIETAAGRQSTGASMPMVISAMPAHIPAVSWSSSTKIPLNATSSGAMRASADTRVRKIAPAVGSRECQKIEDVQDR
jgi:hypothetical protein